jgi:hypothetical protein
MTGEAEMGFTLQGAGPILHWLTLGILCVMPVVIGIIAYKLGGLPGEIARARRHPQAEAIGICGWMGIVTLVLWPVAMVWAHLVPAGTATGGDLSGAEAQSTIGKLQQASRRLAAIEATLPKTPPLRGG